MPRVPYPPDLNIQMLIVALLLFAFILLSLIGALYFMLRQQPGAKKMVYALTIRVGLSIALFAFILTVAWQRLQPPTAQTNTTASLHFS